jgi:hypothetical protein
LFSYAILISLKKDTKKEIPLAGGLSLILAMLWVYKMVFSTKVQSILPISVNLW